CHDDRAPLLDNGQRSGQPLHRLIPGRVERVAGTARNHNVDWRRHRYLDDLLDEANALLPRLNHVAGADPSDASLTVEADVDDKIAAGHLGDACVLFVDRIAFHNATIGVGMLEKLRPMPDLHRVEPRDAGTDDLAAAAVTGHEVRLNQACR